MTATFACPFCGEESVVELDLGESVRTVKMTEDCQNCCRPIALSVTVTEAGRPRINVERES